MAKDSNAQQEPTAAAQNGQGKDDAAKGDKMMSLDEAMVFAEDKYREGRFIMSRNVLQQILAKAPGQAQARNLLAAVFYSLGNFEAAAEHWNEFAKTRPKNGDAQTNLAEVYRVLKRYDKAEEHGNRAIELAPESSAAHNNLGIILQEMGRLPAAMEHIDKAIELEPEFAKAHSNRGNTFRRMNMPWRAIKAYEAGIEIDGKSAELHNHLAVGYLTVNDFDKGLEAIEKAIELDENYAEAYANKALIMFRAEKEGPLPIVNKAIQLNPELTSSYLVRSQIFLEHGWILEAYEDGLKVFSENPEDPEILAQMGAISYQLGKNDDAINYLKKAIERQPNLVRGYVSLANCYADSGRKEEAIELLRKAMSIEVANKAVVYMSLSSVKKFESVDDDDIRAMEGLLHDEPENVTQKQNNCWLHYGLGKAYEDCKDYDKAFANFLAGAAIKKKDLKFDPTKIEEQVDNIIKAFDKHRDRLADLRGINTDLPVFIVGMPRSGTTLLEQVLDSHPDVFGAGELQEMQIIMESIMIDGKQVRYPACIDRMGEKLLKSMGSGYINRVMKKVGMRRRLTDKMPGNHFYAGLITTMFPNAHVINCMRHPLDVCVSNFSILYAQGQDFSYDMEWMGRYYRAYFKLMQYWEETLPKERFMVLEYENNVRDFENQTRRVLDFCGLPFDEKCLDFHKNPRAVRTASSKQVRSPVYTSSFGKWKRYEKYLDVLRENVGEDVISTYEARIGVDG